MGNYDTGAELGINTEQGFMKIGQLDKISGNIYKTVIKPDCFYLPNFYSTQDGYVNEEYINNGNYAISSSNDWYIFDIVKEPYFISKDLNLGIIILFKYGTTDFTFSNVEYIIWGFFDKENSKITETNTEGWTIRKAESYLCISTRIFGLDFSNSKRPNIYMWKNNPDSKIPIGFYIDTSDAEPFKIRAMFAIYEDYNNPSNFKLVDNLPDTWYTSQYEKFYSSYDDYIYFGLVDNQLHYWTYEPLFLEKNNTSSETQGGINDGTYDNSSDVIEIGTLPTFNAVLSNMISIYSPTVAQIQSFD